MNDDFSMPVHFSNPIVGVQVESSTSGHHIDFLETQLDLIAKLGDDLYTQHHIGEPAHVP